MKRIAAICFLFFLCSYTFGQRVSGVVKDGEGEKLFGASVIVKGTLTGMQTDFDGEFEFDPQTEPPFTLVISYLGYEDQEIEITADNIKKKIEVELAGSSVMTDIVEVVDTRITQKQMESPLTVESMGLAAIKQTTSPDFYSGLGNLKGVDLTTASLGFVIVNTRGFNSTRPVRSLQLVDGADNQAPGLNFSLGNFAGSSELDIQKVDLIVGASSATYGPAAFNGVINMSTKNPFYHPGLAVTIKGGERRLFETGLRFAHKFKNKQGKDKFAFKLNFAYMRADDWEADNTDPTPQSLSPKGNPGGNDAVNIYGDENITDATNNFSDPSNVFQKPGLGIIHRTGYHEKDLVDYDTKNLKTGISLHYRVYEDIEAIASYNFGTGTTVYQGDNRYSLKGLKFHQVKFEINKPDKFFIRAYSTMENAGDSYDAVFTAIKLQELVAKNEEWTQSYSQYWSNNIVRKVKALPGYPTGTFSTEEEFYDYINSVNTVLDQNYDSLVAWHQKARAYADNRGIPFSGIQPRLKPGTARFDSIFNEVTSRTSFTEGGTKFYDKSKLMHVQGEYKFTPKWLDISVGGNFRMYFPNSDGTIFSDTVTSNIDTVWDSQATSFELDTTFGRNEIRNWEYGIYTSLQKKVFNNRFIFTATVRMDKNQNFDYLFSPAASVVYSQNDQTVRVSFTSALRNPTLQDQYLYYNVGRALLIGNISGVDGLVTLDSYRDYLDGVLTGGTGLLDSFDVAPVKPERVLSLETGYRGTLFKQLFVDASFYYSWYKDFLGYRIGITPPPDLSSGQRFQSQIYRVSANSPDRVVTYGFSIGLNYYFAKRFMISGNYSWNVLDRKGSNDPIIPAFNTPEHKFNVGIGGKEIAFNLGNFRVKNIGFNLNYKWIQGFEFEGSPQFTGSIPTYSLLDGQINYTNKKIHTTFKLGASNILNKKQYQTYGGPTIGRMLYFSVTFDMKNVFKTKN